jgi:hypothetical protein
VTTRPRLVISELTDEDLRVRVRVDDDTVDPTAWPVEAAWTQPETQPVEDDWVAASWATGGPPYVALVRADQPAGTLRLWLRVTAPTETPVRFIGLVEFHT